MDKRDELKIQRLIALKRYEKPSFQYLNSVESEFSRLIRLEKLRSEENSLRSLFSGVAEFFALEPFQLARQALVASCAVVALVWSYSMFISSKQELAGRNMLASHYLEPLSLKPLVEVKPVLPQFFGLQEQKVKSGVATQFAAPATLSSEVESIPVTFEESKILF